MFYRANGFTHILKIIRIFLLSIQKLKLIHHASIHPVHFDEFSFTCGHMCLKLRAAVIQWSCLLAGPRWIFQTVDQCNFPAYRVLRGREFTGKVHVWQLGRSIDRVSDDLHLGWLIPYVSGHRMPKPCKAMGNLKSDTLSLIHHMNLWIIIWICFLSITAAPPKYHHILLLSSKYSKRSRKVLQRITTSHYQELQRMDLLQPATCFSEIRCPSER